MECVLALLLFFDECFELMTSNDFFNIDLLYFSVQKKCQEFIITRYFRFSRLGLDQANRDYSRDNSGID